MPNYSVLTHWVKERELIRIRKEEERLPEPWTKDLILRTYRFCNVRREDDRVTRWIRDHIRKPFKDHQHLWFMLCIARQINWPPTLLRLILETWPTSNRFDVRRIGEVLNDVGNMGNKIYTGAYMIAAPAEKGADKQRYMATEVLGGQWKRRAFFEKWFSKSRSLNETHQLLMEVNGWGKFMAYQAIVDMRFTRLLQFAPDRRSWAAAGPGTLRGLNRVYGRDVDYRLSQEQALEEMRVIYSLIEGQTGVPMDFSDVPNILCETDKYLRVTLNEGKPRSLYRPHDGSF